MASLRLPTPAADPGRRRSGLASLAPWLVAVGLIGFALLQYGHALNLPFINDDYIFLDKTRDASAGTIWAPRDLLFHYYRPWSRELHYAVLQRLFDARELPFHVASFALWLVLMGLYFALARRIAGAGAATLATAATAALAAWVVPITWAAGAQDLWMLVFALLGMHATVSGRQTLAMIALALALLSKEAAAILPAIAMAYHLRLGRRGVRDALRLTATLWGMVILWGAFHPLLGGRLLAPISETTPIGLHPPLTVIVARTLQAFVNLYPWPRPEPGWWEILRLGLPAMLLLGGLAWLGTAVHRREREAAPRAQRPAGAISFGLAWAVIALLPLLMPTIGWRAHYTLLAAFGSWLAVATLLAPRPWLACALVAALALLRPAVGATPSGDWSTEWYRSRAAAFVGAIRADLLRRHPVLAPHARLWFVRAPSDIGFLAGDAPALRVWYGDPTLSGGYYSAYRPREVASPAGPDHFFRFDSIGGWVEVVAGAEDQARGRQANPRWEKDHLTLARALAEGGDWVRAAVEYEKLAAAAPNRLDYAHDAGVSREATGDSIAAARWYERAAAMPGADAAVRRALERTAHHLHGPR